MSTYYAYGINTYHDDVWGLQYKLKPNAAELLWKKAEKIDCIKEMYDEYCQDNGLDQDIESREGFIDDYENDTTYNTGLEALLVDVINEEIDPVEKPFVYDDYIIGVPATLPVNDAEKASMLTQQRIREILAEYLNPLIETPVVISWYTIAE